MHAELFNFDFTQPRHPHQRGDLVFYGQEILQVLGHSKGETLTVRVPYSQTWTDPRWLPASMLHPTGKNVPVPSWKELKALFEQHVGLSESVCSRNRQADGTVFMYPVTWERAGKPGVVERHHPAGGLCVRLPHFPEEAALVQVLQELQP